MNLQKALQIILLLIVIAQSKAQNTWIKINSEPNYEVGDIIISSKGDFFISLLNSSEVYVSIDSGINWHEVSNKEQIFYGGNQKKYFKKTKDNIFYTQGSFNTKTFKYYNDKFNYIGGVSSSGYQLKINQEGEGFVISNFGMYKTDSNWRADFNKPVFLNNGILESFLFSMENNFLVVSRDPNNVNNNINVVYKLNSNTGSNYEYSIVKALLSPKNIEINNKGQIFFLNDKGNLEASNFDNPNEFKEISIDPKSVINRIYNIGTTSFNQIYVITDKGIYFNIDDINQWIKPIQLNNKFPLFSIYQNTNTYFFRDTSFGILNYSNNCGESETKIFSPKIGKWSKIDLNINKVDLIDLKKSKNGNLFAYKSCETKVEKNYFQSEDEGKSWQEIIINGEYVNCLGITGSGIPIAIANNKLFKYNKFDKIWNLTLEHISNIQGIKYLYFITAESNIFLEGVKFDALGNKTMYLFHSENEGLNWQQIKSFVQAPFDLPGYEIIIKKDGSFLAYGWIDGILKPLISKDKGMTWDIDIMFNDFENTYSMIMVNDGRFIVGGFYDGKYSTFISDSLTNTFEILNPYFNNKSTLLYYRPPSFLFGHNQNNSAPFFSKDLGQSIQEDDTGIYPMNTDWRFFSNAIFDNNLKAYITVRYDGLYVTKSNIFSKVKDYVGNSKVYIEINLLQSDNSLRLIGSFNNEEEIDYKIFNSLGSQVAAGQVIINKDLVRIDKLIPGIYYLQLNSKEAVVRSFKIIKT
ncbi:MAG: hypothetical protein HOP11_00585 [Saprospiraceae bacterium]|nr:hypothetical protein [Saprospiraceae bacterium]